MSEHYVDADFDTSAYGYANAATSNAAISIFGCRKLWCEVLEYAFRAPDIGTYSRTRDFAIVCELAGMDVETMRKAAREVFFGRRSMAPSMGRQMVKA